MLNSASAPSISTLLAPTLGLIVVYAIVLALAYRYAAKTAYARAFFKASTPGAILSVINSGGVYLIVLAASAQFATSTTEFAYNVASATFGLALGWALGIIISPSSKDEASEFSLLTKAVSTFLTGYVLGYLKDLKLPDIQHFLARPGVPFRLMISGACCLSTLAVVFISRRAEAMRVSAVREWFVSYAPPDPKHAQSLRPDVLARGPFASREDALAEIERIKSLDEFKGITLMPVRVDIFSADTTSADATNGMPTNALAKDAGSGSESKKP